MLKIISAWCQLENWSAPAQLGSARNLHSSGSLELENSSSNSSLNYPFCSTWKILGTLFQDRIALFSAVFGVFLSLFFQIDYNNHAATMQKKIKWLLLWKAGCLFLFIICGLYFSCNLVIVVLNKFIFELHKQW